ncbi:MAG: hypothetical protein LUC41_08410, partial [Clostridiales bacterium]|nr:hypothetical protein [Clostridiales bacterium]
QLIRPRTVTDFSGFFTDFLATNPHRTFLKGAEGRPPWSALFFCLEADFLILAHTESVDFVIDRI